MSEILTSSAAGAAGAAGGLRRVRTEAEEQARMAAEVRAGLLATPIPSLPSKYFYDERGGRLFDQITRLPEYYLTRTEEALLPAVARAVDAGGVTAEFNRNILRVINARLGADFDPGLFDHVAFYDAERSWIEMRLRARVGARVHVPKAEVDLFLGVGTEIRTEISCKYTRPALEGMLVETGLRLDQWWTDPESLFALALLRRDAGHRERPSPIPSGRRG